MKNIISYLTLLAVYISSHAQIPNGDWRDHLPYNQGKYLAITPEKVYCAARETGMLSFDKQTGEIEKHSKVTGLSDINISTLSYSQDYNILIIGFQSGYINLLTKDDLIVFQDIKRKNIKGSKTINKIACNGRLAYLACDFGIVVLDLINHEIKDSYLFGPAGTEIKVNDVAIYNNSIYAATDQGVYVADINSPNLLDYSYWNLVNELPSNTSEYKIIESFGDKLLCVYKNSTANSDEIMLYDNNTWSNWMTFQDTLIYEISAYNNQLSISGHNMLEFYNSELHITLTYSNIKTFHALADDDGKIYMTSNSIGFSVSNAPGDIHSFSITGPRFNRTGIVSTYNDHVWVGSGGPFNIYVEGGAYNFYEEKWTSLNSGWTEGISNVGNFYKIAYNPINENHVYLSSYIYGLWEMTDYKVTATHTYDNTQIFNSSINPVVGVRIMGLDFDSKGDLWNILDETPQPVYVLRNGEDWEHLSLKSDAFKSNNNYRDLVVSNEYDQIWILSRKGVIIVLKEEPDGTILEKEFIIKNQDNQLIRTTYCMTEDKEGNIWIGTNMGPIIYTPSSNIFNQENISGFQVSIPRDDDSGLADYLLNYEIISEIAVDGGDRKWIATENSGVFLVSPDGKKTIHHFTFDNSPLISNNIIGIGVQEKTGEVFISTNKGIVSYMGNATEGYNDYTNVYVYPNPVRPDYRGEITITGLIKDSNVKITDISGNLVYETTSFGGQAVWDGLNFDGNRVHTGVYLVFLSNEDGNKTHITKLLFVR